MGDAAEAAAPATAPTTGAGALVEARGVDPEIRRADRARARRRDVRAGQPHRRHRAVGLGQVDAPRAPRGARPARHGRRPRRRSVRLVARPRRAGRASRCADRRRRADAGLSGVLTPVENVELALALRGADGRRRTSARWRRSRSSVSPTTPGAPSTASRRASASGWPSPAPSRPAPPCSSPTSRPRGSTASRRSPSAGLLADLALRARDDRDLRDARPAPRLPGGCRAAARGRRATIGVMATATDTLHVQGIRCERCVMRLASALEGAPGLEHANANLLGDVTLAWDDGLTTRRRSSAPSPTRASTSGPPGNSGVAAGVLLPVTWIR